MSTYCDLGRALRLSPAETLAAAYAANPLVRSLTESDERELAAEGRDPRLVATPALTWPPNTAINVHFDGGTAADRARVTTVAETWERKANVFLTYSESQPSQLRIRFDPNDGNWSALGTQAVAPSYAGRTTMNLANRDGAGVLLEGTILHELGHAFGFHHEHQHPECTIQWNEAAVIKYFTGPPNNWAESKIRDQILTRLNPRGKFWGPWDRTSIMEYEIQPGWNLAGDHIGPNNLLSTEDVRVAQQLYPNRIERVSATHAIELRYPGPGFEAVAIVSTAEGAGPIEITTPAGLTLALFDRSAVPGRLVTRSLEAGRHEIVLDSPPGEYALRLRGSDSEAASSGTIRIRIGGGESSSRGPVPEYTYKIFSGDTVELVPTSISPAGALFHVTFGDPTNVSGYIRPYQGQVVNLIDQFVAGANQVNLRHISNDGPWTVAYDLRINGKTADNAPFTGSGSAWYLDRFHAIANLTFLYKG